MIFIDNKYTRLYFNIINNAKSRTDYTGYVEKHHIIPKSLGGTNKKNNLVELTAKEHYICHRLLVKMVEGDYKRKMYYALSCLIYRKTRHQRRYIPNAAVFEKVRNEWRAGLKGRSGPNLGKSPSNETRQKLRNANKGKSTYIRSDEHKK